MYETRETEEGPPKESVTKKMEGCFEGMSVACRWELRIRGGLAEGKLKLRKEIGGMRKDGGTEGKTEDVDREVTKERRHAFLVLVKEREDEGRGVGTCGREDEGLESGREEELLN